MSKTNELVERPVTTGAGAGAPVPAPPPNEVPDAPAVSRSAVWMDRLSPRRLSAIYLAVIFLVLFTLLNPGTFFTDTTMTVVFSSGVVTCLLALAFLVPLMGGAYDLSIGTMMTFSLTITVKLFQGGMSPVLAAVIALVACGFVGAFSGFVIIKLRVNSFIATLGTSQVLLAAVLLISGNTQLVGDFPDSWSSLGRNNVAGIPLALVYLIVIAAIMWYVLEFTRVGRYLFATGGNPDAARLSGVKTDRMLWGAMIASALIAGLAGVISSMQVGVVTSVLGDGLLFPAVAAVFLGASQFAQRPNVWGTLIAYFTLAFGIQGLSLSLGSSASWSGPLFQGVALIIAVAVASRPVMRDLRSRKATADDATVDPPSAAIDPAAATPARHG